MYAGQNYGWVNALSDVLSTAITKNAQDKQYQQGLDYISQQEAQNKALSAAQQDYAKVQDWYAQANKIMSLNKDWTNYQAQGLDNNDPRMQKIITDSQAVRQYAQQKGYNLPGQDVPYGNIQGFIDNEGSAQIAKIAKSMKKSGYAGAGQFVRPSDMGHDVGPTQAPTYNLDTSLQGMGNYIKQSQAENNSPLSLMTGMAKLNISPEVMQKLAPLYNAYMKSNNDQEAIALLGQYQTEPDPAKKTQILQRYYSLFGDKVNPKDLTPKTGMATVDTNDKIKMVQTTQPNAYGFGPTSVNDVETYNKGIAPATQAQLNLQKKTQADNSALNWARLANDANSIKHYMTTDSGDVIGFTGDGQAHRLANVSSFSKSDQMKIKALQTNMTSALQLYKASANQYDPTAITPGMQQAMDDYNSSKAQLDTMLGIGQGNSVKQDSIAKMIDQAKASNYSKEQILDMLHNKGYTEYDSYVW